jgi:hypothetical protein
MACIGQGFWDQEAPGNGLLVGYPKALLEVKAGNGNHVHGYLYDYHWSSDECAQGKKCPKAPIWHLLLWRCTV